MTSRRPDGVMAVTLVKVMGGRIVRADHFYKEVTRLLEEFKDGVHLERVLDSLGRVDFTVIYWADSLDTVVRFSTGIREIEGVADTETIVGEEVYAARQRS